MSGMRPASRLSISVLSLLTALSLYSSDLTYRSVSVDTAGQVHIVLQSGQEILPNKTEGQVSFDAARLSEDFRTVGWLIMYPFPGSNARPIAGGLALFRAGRIIHRLETDQVFWDWRFQDGGKRVAYSTGPTHGVAAECVLRDVETATVAAQRWVAPEAEPPLWARDLRR